MRTLYLLSSPNLSRRRLDVCHTSTHGVALVRIYDAGLKCAPFPRNMVNFSPLTAEICWRVWGTAANFNRFCVLALLLHPRCAMEVSNTLQNVWSYPALVHYKYNFRSSFFNGILPAAKFTLRPTLVFSYIGSVTTWHLSSGRQPNFVVWYQEWDYGTFAEGATCIRLGSYHVGHRPTF